MESDVSYFRRRASEERAAALQAQHAQVRQNHREMAERYDDLVRGITAREEYLGLQSLTGSDGDRETPVITH